MGLSPKWKAQGKHEVQSRQTMQRNHPLWPRVPLASAHINKLMIIAKGEEPHTKQSNKQKGKLEYTTVYHTVTCHPTFQLVYIIQTCY